MKVLVISALCVLLAASVSAEVSPLLSLVQRNQHLFDEDFDAGTSFVQEEGWDNAQVAAKEVAIAHESEAKAAQAGQKALLAMHTHRSNVVGANVAAANELAASQGAFFEEARALLRGSKKSKTELVALGRKKKRPDITAQETKLAKQNSLGRTRAKMSAQAAAMEAKAAEATARASQFQREAAAEVARSVSSESKVLEAIQEAYENAKTKADAMAEVAAASVESAIALDDKKIQSTKDIVRARHTAAKAAAKAAAGTSRAMAAVHSVANSQMARGRKAIDLAAAAGDQATKAAQLAQDAMKLAGKAADAEVNTRPR